MRATTITRAMAATAVIVAVALVLLARAPHESSAPVARSEETLAIAVSDTPAPSADPPAMAHDAPAAVKVRELEAMSETYRNTTFVIAIRDAGYVCNELLRVYGGIDDSGKWTATCSEMLAYTVGVMADGDLHVEPMMQYFDSPTPFPIQNDNTVPPPQPRRGLEPR